MGYNSIEAEDWEIATRGEDIGKLETLLLEKNRRMEHELTQVKVHFYTYLLQFLVMFVISCGDVSNLTLISNCPVSNESEIT